MAMPSVDCRYPQPIRLAVSERCASLMAKRSGSISAARRCWSASSTAIPRCPGRAARPRPDRAEDELVELLVREIERGARGAPRGRRGRARHPGDDRPRSRRRGLRRQPADREPADPRPRRRARPACRSSSTTTPTWPRSPSTSTAPRSGSRQHGDADDRHRDRRRPDPRRRDLPRRDRRRRRARPHGDRRPTARPARATAPATAASRRSPRARRWAARARAAAEREPDSALGKMLAAGETVDGTAVTEAALAGDATSIGVFELIGRRLGVALASFANIFEPDVIVDRRRRDRRRRPAARAGAPRARASGRCRR